MEPIEWILGVIAASLLTQIGMSIYELFKNKPSWLRKSHGARPYKTSEAKDSPKKHIEVEHIKRTIKIEDIDSSTLQSKTTKIKGNKSIVDKLRNLKK